MSDARYQVQLTESAERDVDSVLAWFAEQKAREAGSTWVVQLLKKIASLESRPERCPLAEESVELDIQIREILFGRRQHKFRILFRIAGHQVFVIRIWRASRGTINSDSLHS